MTETLGSRKGSVMRLLKANKGVRILWIIQLLGLVFIILNPIGLPMEIDDYSRGFYNDMLAIPDNSVVVIQSQCSFAFLPESYPGAVAVLNLLFEKDVKIVIWVVTQDGVIFMPQILDEVDPSVLEQKTYGEDWVFFGWAPGAEAAIAAFSSDIRSVYQVDIYGTPIDELPMMDNINSHEDIDIVISISGSLPMDEASVRQWVAPYNMPYYMLTFASCFTNMQPYYPDQIKGMTNGILGSAQLELLVGKPGKGAQNSDSITFVMFLSLASLFAGNVYYQYEKRKGDK